MLMKNHLDLTEDLQHELWFFSSCLLIRDLQSLPLSSSALTNQQPVDDLSRTPSINHLLLFLHVIQKSRFWSGSEGKMLHQNNHYWFYSWWPSAVNAHSSYLYHKVAVQHKPKWKLFSALLSLLRVQQTEEVKINSPHFSLLPRTQRKGSRGSPNMVCRRMMPLWCNVS